MKLKKELIRSLIAGPVVGATDFGVYFLLKIFLPIWLSKGISYVCAGIASYLLSKYWTFSRPKESAHEMGRYWIGPWPP